MRRSLIWIQADQDAGWACSSCRWRFPVPALLGAGEAKDAYDRLAATRFREHECETEKPSAATTQSSGPNFADRARLLIMRGCKPKDAVELVLKDIALAHPNKPEVLEQARVAAEEFLQKIRKGLI